MTSYNRTEKEKKVPPCVCLSPVLRGAGGSHVYVRVYVCVCVCVCARARVGNNNNNRQNSINRYNNNNIHNYYKSPYSNTT